MEFFVIDTGLEGHSDGTLQAHGPFPSQARAEHWIKTTAAADWINSCGCLRDGPRKEWGDDYHIVQVVRTVRPVPPTDIRMTLVDTSSITS